MAAKYFCLVEFSEGISEHAEVLRKLGWKLKSEGKMEFTVKHPKMLQEARVEGADHDDMPARHIHHHHHAHHH